MRPPEQESNTTLVKRLRQSWHDRWDTAPDATADHELWQGLSRRAKVGLALGMFAGLASVSFAVTAKAADAAETPTISVLAQEVSPIPSQETISTSDSLSIDPMVKLGLGIGVATGLVLKAEELHYRRGGPKLVQS